MQCTSSPIQVFPPEEEKATHDRLALLVGLVVFFATGFAVAVQF